MISYRWRLGQVYYENLGEVWGEEYYITVTNAICCTLRQLSAMPLSTKRMKNGKGGASSLNTESISLFIVPADLHF